MSEKQLGDELWRIRIEIGKLLAALEDAGSKIERGDLVKVGEAMSLVDEYATIICLKVEKAKFTYALIGHEERDFFAEKQEAEKELSLEQVSSRPEDLIV